MEDSEHQSLGGYAAPPARSAGEDGRGGEAALRLDNRTYLDNGNTGSTSETMATAWRKSAGRLLQPTSGQVWAGPERGPQKKMKNALSDRPALGFGISFWQPAPIIF